MLMYWWLDDDDGLLERKNPYEREQKKKAEEKKSSINERGIKIKYIRAWLKSLFLLLLLLAIPLFTC